MARSGKDSRRSMGQTASKDPAAPDVEAAGDAAPHLAPEPPAPLLFDEEGEPLMPHPAFEAIARREVASAHPWQGAPPGGRKRPTCEGVDCLFHGREDYNAQDTLRVVQRALSEADGAGRVASFPVWLVLEWALACAGHKVDRVHGGRWDGDVAWIKRWAREDVTERVFWKLQTPERTLLWTHNRRILAVGPLAPDVGELLAPHHKLARPPALLRWQEAVAQWNPWHTGGEGGLAASKRWQALVADASTELGFSLEKTIARWRKDVEGESHGGPPAPARLATAEETKIARKALAHLAARPWRIEDWQRAWPLRLDSASRARFAILLRPGDRERLHVVADVGGGLLLRILVVHFPREEATEIVPCGGEREMDGGDVHIWVEEKWDSVLEVCGRTGRRRRGEEEG